MTTYTCPPPPKDSPRSGGRIREIQTIVKTAVNERALLAILAQDRNDSSNGGRFNGAPETYEFFVNAVDMVYQSVGGNQLLPSMLHEGQLNFTVHVVDSRLIYLAIRWLSTPCVSVHTCCRFIFLQ